MLASKKGDSRQAVYLFTFMVVLLVTEVAGLKFASAGFAVSGMAIEAAGAFAASKSNQQLGLSFLLGALIGLVGAFIGTFLCLKLAFDSVSTMVVVSMVVLIISALAGEIMRMKVAEDSYHAH